MGTVHEDFDKIQSAHRTAVAHGEESFDTYVLELWLSSQSDPEGASGDLKYPSSELALYVAEVLQTKWDLNDENVDL